ncbi:class I SAM-dependent RNA methyltransferase [Granulosicoccus antarcticus]|uniref:23S rRNA (Uracil(1939)-C(5))-methyltransferase RlmD n=1 Tax=Granulosicoccus antarcticus IMCC3135 TaxID=1192854 RepID=A0A2Z2NZU7_9GAMM|nr:methyltransferase domain-containing protein [Granulosicoccus antarcticus]ASJ74430.1 23S rRNA (uracil(1939)-C(5))-methyltransferase RlmD [Granulosicoccus antarcticus IMCC3135]
MKDKSGWNKYRHKRPEIVPRESELVIESLTNAGDGLGREEQRVIFVPYTVPGDRVRIKITQRKKTYALASVVEILEPSKDRISAPCEYFERCGGCDWQHVPYAVQLSAKQEQLTDTLARIGLLENLPMKTITPSPQEYGYRNRIQGEIRAGQFHYKWRRSDQRIAIDKCVIAEDAINEYLASTDLTQTLQGRVEISVEDGVVTMSAVNDRNSTELGFRQVNTAVSDVLTARLLELVGKSECQHIVDLYCGRGHWTNLIAQTHPDRKVVGVDVSAENIDAARAQTHELALENVAFHQAEVEKTLKKLGIKESLCIVDPPRSGLDTTVIDTLIEEPCKHLLYVSCHPATLARDLKRLTESGYRVVSVESLDMFPQTAHLESLVHLERI